MIKWAVEFPHSSWRHGKVWQKIHLSIIRYQMRLMMRVCGSGASVSVSDHQYQTRPRPPNDKRTGQGQRGGWPVTWTSLKMEKKYYTRCCQQPWLSHTADRHRQKKQQLLTSWHHRTERAELEKGVNPPGQPRGLPPGFHSFPLKAKWLVHSSIHPRERLASILEIFDKTISTYLESPSHASGGGGCFYFGRF